MNTPTECILNDLSNCSDFVMRCPNQYGEWMVEFEYDRIIITGKGDSIEAALIEALVTRRIADYFYFGDWDIDLSQEQMDEWLYNAYEFYGLERPKHSYRGSYSKKGEKS